MRGIQRTPAKLYKLGLYRPPIAHVLQQLIPAMPFNLNGGVDGTRTRGLCRDRAAF